MNRDDLDAIRIDIWDRLKAGASDRRSAFHTPVIASVDQAGLAHQRIMVMRAAIPESRQLRFHTDVRTPKVGQIGIHKPVSILGYDPVVKIQIRAWGNGRVEANSELTDAAWDASSASSRRCYLAPLAPGSAHVGPTSGLPLNVENRVPNMEEAIPGRANFAVLLVTLDRLEWLYLAANGHRRAEFRWTDNSWDGNWLVP
jgi:pyridoxine/pyridoxamine 5'-phosphate oxidase